MNLAKNLLSSLGPTMSLTISVNKIGQKSLLLLQLESGSWNVVISKTCIIILVKDDEDPG